MISAHDRPGIHLPHRGALGATSAVEAFLLDRRLRNCTVRTQETYRRNLERFVAALGEEPAQWRVLAVRRYLTDLQTGMSGVTVHQHYRCLRTFLGWAKATGYLAEDPMRGITMKCPKTLPRVPEDEDVRRLLAACPPTFEGTRDRALIAVLADSALRVSEALRLRIEDVNLATKTIRIRQGKGQKDGVGFFSDTAWIALRTWIALRPGADGHLFVTRDGRPMTRFRALAILHRLSIRAQLARKWGPHSLRHYAATSLLRETGNLELVRQVLRHESLTMTLRYARLVMPEVAARFRSASPLDHLARGGRKGR